MGIKSIFIQSILLYVGLLLSASVQAQFSFTTKSDTVLNLAIDPGTNNGGAVLELQTAIRTVRAGGASGIINLFTNGTYTFTQPDNWEYGPNALPQISGNITINGQGATLQRATNAPKFRFFYVSGGLSYETNTGVGLPTGSLTLNNLTLTGGLAEGGDGAGGGAGMGGAIFNQGTLAMTAANFIGNMAQGGVGGVGGGGGGIGGDADEYGDGGGFGGPFSGLGGSGFTGYTNSYPGPYIPPQGGGGGFRPYDNSDGGGGGGFGGLGAGGGDGGDGGSWMDFFCAGGNFGYGGQGGISDNPDGMNGGGGGGVGGGGGNFGGQLAINGDGGFGGGGGGGGMGAGSGGFGGGGGGNSWWYGGGSLFAGGSGSGPEDLNGYGGGGGGGLGGAIFNHRGMLLLTNCIITSNIALGGDSTREPEPIPTVGNYGPDTWYLGAGSGYGGGIFNLNGTVILDGCTLSSNNVDPGNFYQTGYGWAASSVWAASDQADGGALYNLAFGNRIEDGIVSTATAILVNSVLTNSSTGPLVEVLVEDIEDDSFLTVTNSYTMNDLVNNEVNGNQTNIATVVFSTDSPALVHVDLAQAQSVTAATFSQAALLSAPTITGDPVFQFKVIGVPGYSYVIQASTNMTDWVSVQTNVCPFVFEDTNSTNYPARYYRAFYQPPTN